MAKPRTLFTQLTITLLLSQAAMAAIVLTAFWPSLQGATTAQDDDAAATAPRHGTIRVVAWTAAACVAASVIGAWAITRRWRAGLRTLAEGAPRMVDGRWDHRFDEPRSQELSELAVAMHRLLADLGARLAQLQGQRNELQATVQSLGSGVVALDREQRILSVNRAAERILGLTSALARGRLLQEVVRQPALNQFVSDALLSDSGARNELVLDGEAPMVLQAVGEPLRDSAQRGGGLVLLLNDVTELRRLETIRSEFAANVSHELRTPITNISGYVETLLHVGADDPGQARGFLQIIKRNTDRLASIIEDLLSLARLEQPESRAWLDPEPAPVRWLVSAAAGQFEDEAAAKNIAIILDVPDAISVNVNARLVEQALANLFSNAIKYSPPGTTVSVRAKLTPDGMVEIEVADEGPGIDPRHLPRIFERFYRVDRARSRQLGGTGLGLAIVKHIAQAHGGSVGVQSVVGQGSTFRLLLPAA